MNQQQVNKVVLRSVGLTMMVVAPTAGEAVRIVEELPEVQGAVINSAEVKPMGGAEYLKMTQDFVKETSSYVPGTEDWRWRLNSQDNLAVWLVTISYTVQVSWSQQRSAGDQAGEGEGKVAGSIRPADGTSAAPVSELPLSAGDDPAPAVLSTDPNDKQ